MDTNRLDCTQSTIASTREVEKEGGRVVEADDGQRIGKAEVDVARSRSRPIPPVPPSCT